MKELSSSRRSPRPLACFKAPRLFPRLPSRALTCHNTNAASVSDLSAFAKFCFCLGIESAETQQAERVFPPALFRFLPIKFWSSFAEA